MSIPEVQVDWLVGAEYVPMETKHKGDVGLDIPAILECDRLVLAPGEGRFIPGGFRVQFQSGWAGLILPRSSSNRMGLHIYTGVIDNGYNGELGTEVRNISNQSLLINNGDRISQLVLIPAFRPIPVPVLNFRETDRGDKGFGSSNDPIETNPSRGAA